MSVRMRVRCVSEVRELASDRPRAGSPARALRRVGDIAAIAAILVALVAAARPRTHITTCDSLAGAPHYDAWHGPITVAAVFGAIDDTAHDPGAWSYRAFEAALVQRGFLRIAPDRYVASDMTVDVVPPLARDPETVAPVVSAELATHDLVYYDGHDFDGRMQLTAPATGYHLIVLDACWSTQHYSPLLLGPHVDVVGNSERSVTGSYQSFLAFLDGIRAHAAWAQLVARMNELAARRLPMRPARPELDRAEHYRHDVACR